MLPSATAEHVGVAEHAALRRPGRARGVDDRRGVLGVSAALAGRRPGGAPRVAQARRASSRRRRVPSSTITCSSAGSRSRPASIFCRLRGVLDEHHGCSRSAPRTYAHLLRRVGVVDRRPRWRRRCSAPRSASTHSGRVDGQDRRHGRRRRHPARRGRRRCPRTAAPQLCIADRRAPGGAQGVPAWRRRRGRVASVRGDRADVSAMRVMRSSSCAACAVERRARGRVEHLGRPAEWCRAGPAAGPAA